MSKFKMLIMYSVLLWNINAFAQTIDQGADSRGYKVKVGDNCPAFTMTLADGSKMNTTDFIGKVVMLQFTASWCMVCKNEMPYIESDIQQKYIGRKDFILIGIDRDEPIDKVNAFALQMKITYPLALDPGATIFQLFAAKEAGVTRNVILDRTGKIIFLTRLYDEEEFKDMKQVIEDALSKP